MGETFIINRIELKRMLNLMGVSAKSEIGLEGDLNRMHRHINAVSFAGMLLKLGLSRDSIMTVFRKMGLDDISIINVLNALDEEKINEAFGKVAELSIE
jgi:hypothetical protein